MMLNSTYGHDLNENFAVAISVVFILIAVTGVIFNILISYIILSKRSLQTTTNLLIVNLAVADFITAVFTVPFDVDFILRGYFPYGVTACFFKETAFMLSLPTSVVNLSLLTFERFFSVKYPFLKMRYFNKRKMTIAVVVGWVYSLLVALFPVLYDKNAVIVKYGKCLFSIPLQYQIYQVTINFFAPLLLILILNGVLFSVAANHATRIRRLSYRPSGSLKSRKSRTSSIVPDMLVVNLKAAKTVFTLVGVFTFSWITFIVLAIWNVLCGICHPREITWSANAINYSNIAINPILFGLLNKELRKHILKRFHLFRHVRKDMKSSFTFEEKSFLKNEGNFDRKVSPTRCQDYQV